MSHWLDFLQESLGLFIEYVTLIFVHFNSFSDQSLRNFKLTKLLGVPFSVNFKYILWIALKIELPSDIFKFENCNILFDSIDVCVQNVFNYSSWGKTRKNWEWIAILHNSNFKLVTIFFSKRLEKRTKLIWIRMKRQPFL